MNKSAYPARLTRIPSRQVLPFRLTAAARVTLKAACSYGHHAITTAIEMISSGDYGVESMARDFSSPSMSGSFPPAAQLSPAMRGHSKKVAPRNSCHESGLSVWARLTMLFLREQLPLLAGFARENGARVV